MDIKNGYNKNLASNLFLGETQPPQNSVSYWNSNFNFTSITITCLGVFWKSTEL